MTAPDTSTANVERVAARFDAEGQYGDLAAACGDDEHVGYCREMTEAAALLRALAAERDAAVTVERERVAVFMLNHGFATGHGDTANDLLFELGGQLPARIAAVVLAERGACANLLACAATTARMQPGGDSPRMQASAETLEAAAVEIRARPAPDGADALAERDRRVRREALEEAVEIVERYTSWSRATPADCVAAIRRQMEPAALRARAEEAGDE